MKTQIRFCSLRSATMLHNIASSKNNYLKTKFVLRQKLIEQMRHCRIILLLVSTYAMIHEMKEKLGLYICLMKQYG